MAYVTVHTETITSPTYTVAFDSFFASEAQTVGLRVYRNNILQTTPAQYTIENLILNADMLMVGDVVFINELGTAETVQITADDTWKDNLAGYITYSQAAANVQLQDHESRISALETKVLALQNDNADKETRIQSLEAFVVAYNAGVPATLVSIQNDLDLAELDIVALDGRVDRLDDKVGVDGSISILNNQATPLNIPDFTFDVNDVQTVFIDYVLERTTGTDYRKSTGTLVIACKANIDWVFDRGVSYIDVDAVSFQITTDVGVISNVTYTSDNMAGGGYVGTFKYTIRKTEV